jgi:hypothetical protein
VGRVIRLRREISKKKDGRLLPVKGGLSEIVESAKANRLLSCPFVFHDKGQRIVSFRKAWEKRLQSRWGRTDHCPSPTRSAVRNRILSNQDA